MASSIQRYIKPLLLLPALCGLLWLPQLATAQIASPTNAGGNAGNNSPGSSESPISTPNFSPVQTVSTVPGVTVATDGTISVAPAVQVTANNAVSAAASSAEASPLAPVAGATASAVSATELVSPDQQPELSLASGARQSTQTLTFLTLATEISKEFTAGSIGGNFTVTNLRTGNTGTVVLAQGSIVVTVAGSEVVIPVTSQNQVVVAQFAAIAIAAGLSTQAIAAGQQLVAAGATPIQVSQLMVSLQGLATATTVTPLSNGINALNAIINNTPDAGVVALANNSTFMAARALLIAGRNSLGS